MSAYDDEILADSPVAYWKAEDLTGTVMTDSSGNDEHGTIFTTDPFPILGVPGPIETDGTSLGVSSRFGEHATVSGSSLDLRGNFTWEIWGVVNDLIQDYGALCRNGSFGLLGSNCVGFNSGHIFARLSDGVTTIDLSDTNTAVLGVYYHIVVTRNTNVVVLTVNGEERDTDTGFPAGDIVYPDYNDGDWLVGAFRPSGTANNGYRTSHAALYSTAITLARRQAHYEAAINALLLSGYSNVAPSAILYSDVEPNPISFPFRHNWSEPLIERISFLTNVSKTRSGLEENGQGRPNPRREIEIAQLLRDDSERRKLRAKLWAHQDKKWFVPIREDFEQLSSPLSSGVNVIPVTTQYRDYEVGAWVGLRELNDQGQIVKSETLEITARNPSDVHSLTNTVNSYSAFKSYVYPVRRAYIPRTIAIRGHTDAVEDLTVVARLVAEDEPTIPNRITPWTPTITYKGFEVHDPAIWPSNDWSSTRDCDVDRELTDIDFDIGTFGMESDAPGAAEAIPYSFALKGRDKIAQFLGWFYARNGSLNYLWVPTMQKDFKIVSVAGANLTVEGVEYSENYALAQARRDLAFVYHDNTMIFRRVLSFSGSPDETLVLDSNVPTQTNLRSVSLLKFCRMDGDSIEIARITDDVARFAWRFREMLSTPT